MTDTFPGVRKTAKPVALNWRFHRITFILPIFILIPCFWPTRKFDGVPMKQQRGLAISTILLAVILLIAIAVTLAMSSRASNGNSSQQQAKLFATTLMNQANALKIGFDKMQANGIDFNNIRFNVNSNSGVYGLFNPTYGGTEEQFPPINALFNPSAPGYTDWRYNNNIMLKGVGTDNGIDAVVVMADISLTVCQAINNALHGISLSSTPPQSDSPTATTTNFTIGDVGGTSGPTIDMRNDSHIQNWTEGCMLTDDSGTHYLYFKTVNEL